MNTLLNFEHTHLMNQDIAQLQQSQSFAAYMHTMSTGHSSTVDRTNTFLMPLAFEVTSPLLPVQGSVPNYTECCDSSACQILDNMTDQSLLYILYSGGVDSTCVLVALLRNSNEQQRKRFVIVLSLESINENRNFFIQYILGKLNYISWTQFSKITLTSDDIVTHGEANDQLFDTAEHLSKDYSTNKTATVDVPIICQMLLNFSESNEYNLQTADIYKFILDNSAKAVGLELSTIADYHQWQMLNFIHQFTSLRPMFYFVGKAKNMQAFYAHECFDKWVIDKIANHKYATDRSYKKESKDYIFMFDKNEHYKNNKHKVGSGPRLSIFQNPTWAINSKFEMVETVDLYQYYQPNNVFAKIFGA